MLFHDDGCLWLALRACSQRGACVAAQGAAAGLSDAGAPHARAPSQAGAAAGARPARRPSYGRQGPAAHLLGAGQRERDPAAAGRHRGLKVRVHGRQHRQHLRPSPGQGGDAGRLRAWPQLRRRRPQPGMPCCSRLVPHCHLNIKYLWTARGVCAYCGCTPRLVRHATAPMCTARHGPDCTWPSLQKRRPSAGRTAVRMRPDRAGRAGGRAAGRAARAPCPGRPGR